MSLESDLRQFSGSDEVYRHNIGRLLYTQGIQYLAEHASAYWLIDLIASYQGYAKVKAESFQLWSLVVAEGGAMATMRRDTGCEPIISQGIEYTDFPLPEIKLYVCNGVLMLPGEY